MHVHRLHGACAWWQLLPTVPSGSQETLPPRTWMAPWLAVRVAPVVLDTRSHYPPPDYGFDPLNLGSDPQLLKWYVVTLGCDTRSARMSTGLCRQSWCTAALP